MIPAVVKAESDVERQLVEVIAAPVTKPAPKPTPLPTPPPNGTPPTNGTPPPTNGTPPPVTPPPATTPTQGYYLCVRKDGNMEPSFAVTMANPGWKQLVDMGHIVKEMTLTESLKYYVPPDNTALPYTVTLDAKTGKVLAEAIPTPTTTESIVKLSENVK